MKIQKSAMPYLILLLGLFVGIPTTDYLLSQNQDAGVVVIPIGQDVNLADQEEGETELLAKFP